MRQVNAVNGSQMVVKIGVAYYRRVKGEGGGEKGEFVSFSVF